MLLGLHTQLCSPQRLADNTKGGGKERQVRGEEFKKVKDAPNYFVLRTWCSSASSSG